MSGRILALLACACLALAVAIPAAVTIGDAFGRAGATLGSAAR